MKNSDKIEFKFSLDCEAAELLELHLRNTGQTLEESILNSYWRCLYDLSQDMRFAAKIAKKISGELEWDLTWYDDDGNMCSNYSEDFLKKFLPQIGKMNTNDLIAFGKKLYEAEEILSDTAERERIYYDIRLHCIINLKMSAEEVAAICSFID